MTIYSLLNSSTMNFTDNQHSSVVLEKLWSQREAGRFCDLVLHVQGQKFFAHRNVLAACSPFFDSVLKSRKIVKEQLTITCQNIDAFQLLLNYFYTGAIVIDKNTVGEILRLANHFLVVKIKNYCAEFLNRYLDVSNCLSTKEMAEKYGLPNLLRNVLTFVNNHIIEIFQRNEVLDFTLSKLETFIDDKQFHFPQQPLLVFLCKWVEHDFENRETSFESLIPLINFDCIDLHSLYEHVKSSSLFHKSSKCMFDILNYLDQKKIDISDFNATYTSLKEQFTVNQKNITNDSVPDITKLVTRTRSKNIHNESNIEDNAPITVAPLEKESYKENQSTILDSSELVKVSYSDTSNSDSEVAAPDFGADNYDEDTQTSEAEEIDMTPINGHKNSSKIRETPLRSNVSQNRKTVPPLKISRKSSGSVAVKSARKSKAKAIKIVKKNKLGIVTKHKPQLKSKRYVSETDTEDDDDDNDIHDDGSSSATDSSYQEDNNEDNMNGYGGKLKWKDGVKCPNCSYIAHSSVRLEQHVSRIHAKDVTYKCKVCEFTCKWNREYYLHMKTHFQGPPFRCENCDYTCDRIQFLLSHQMRHTDERPFKCDECDHRCRTKANLDCHMRCHTGEKPYQCEHCERRFAIKASLDQHLASHREDRPFLCDTCGFSTKYQSHLFSHKRIHTGDVFHCQFPDCKYSTPKKSQLGSHHRTHTAVRSHICAICGRAFIEKSHLVRHERIHLNEKPFKCEHCDYSSSRKDKLKEHFRKHHGENATAVVPYRPRKQRRQVPQESPSYASLSKMSNESTENQQNQIHPLIELAEAVTAAAANASVTNNPTPVVYTYETTHPESIHPHTAVTLQQMDAVAHNYQIAFMDTRHHQPVHHHHHLQHTHLTHGHPHVGPAPPLAVPALMSDQNRVVVSTHDGTSVVGPSQEFSPYMQFM